MDKYGKGGGAPQATADVIRFAIEREEEAAHLYGGLADRAASGNKALFLDLQTEEMHHKKLLEDLVSGRGKAVTLRSVPDLKIVDYVVEEPIGADSPFQDILIFAAKKEAKAAALYTALLEQSTEPDHRRLFEFLIQQEKRHKLRLEEEYERHVLEEN